MASTKSLAVPKSVLVIGGGPAGLVGLRNFVERGAFEHIELWERRDDVGGVWYLDEPEDGSAITRPRWPSPAYKGLIGNVLPEFLSFSEFPFPVPPRPRQPFPSLSETHAYLRAVAAPYRDWNSDGREVEEEWDAVAVAVGWYDHPVWPNTEGLEKLKAIGLAKHAKCYRGPAGYEGKASSLFNTFPCVDLDYAYCATGYRPLPNFVHVRVPMLHRFVMYARNPSLAFIGAPMVYTPFIIADVVSIWLALAWRGEVSYPDTPEERLAYERDRLSKIARIRLEMENPTSFLTFSVMATDEQEYAARLREEAVEARPELDPILPIWNDERTEAREAMFQTKYRALEYARDHPARM